MQAIGPLKANLQQLNLSDCLSLRGAGLAISPNARNCNI